MSNVDVCVYRLAPARGVPNNAVCALIVYPQVLDRDCGDPAAELERLFTANGWRGTWRNGIFSDHHFHSTAHEVLGIYSGGATVQFGGEEGVTVTAGYGDVIVVPAGVAHKKLDSHGGLGVVGAYPAGQRADMNIVGQVDHRNAAFRISQVPLPERDPVFGVGGPLFEHWSLVPLGTNTHTFSGSEKSIVKTQRAQDWRGQFK